MHAKLSLHAGIDHQDTIQQPKTCNVTQEARDTGEGGLIVSDPFSSLCCLPPHLSFTALLGFCQATMWLQSTLTCLLACAVGTRAAVQADSNMKSIPVSTTDRILLHYALIRLDKF